MTENGDVRLGVIGTGNIGRVHVAEFVRHPDVQVRAVTDAYLPGARAAAAEYGVPVVHETAEELIADPSIDAVVIAVPNRFHGPLAVRALEAGKHVLLEKPMAIDVEDARRIVRAQKESGRVLMIPHQMRWEHSSIQVKEQIDKGALGWIYHAKAGWFRRKGIPGWGTWFTRREESGGGPLIDIGVHLLDLAFHLMGDVRPVSVFGSTYAEFGPKRKGIGTWGKPDWSGFYDVEDLATALIRMENGATISLEVSWAVHAEIEKNEPFLHLMGSEAGARIEGDEAVIYTEAFDRTVDVNLGRPSEDEGSRARMSRHFIECIREGKESLTNAMTGFACNLVLDAIYRSAASGEAIELDWSV